MSIPFTCPHCGHYTDVDAQYAGTAGPCSRCGKQVVIPERAQGKSRSAGLGDPYGLLMSVGVIAGLVLIVLLGTTAFTWVRYRAITRPTLTAAETQSGNNLRLIAIALRNYQAANGTLPPAVVTDNAGRPMHSWRVLLLPYLGQQPAYSQYDFQQPWNSPHNRKVLASISPYSTPERAGAGLANYQLITGTECLFSGSRLADISQVTDPQRDTVLVVEVPNTNVRWTEPKDIDIGRFNRGTLTQIVGRAQRRANLLIMVDQTVVRVPGDVPGAKVQAAATIGGNEPIRLP